MSRVIAAAAVAAVVGAAIWFALPRAGTRAFDLARDVDACVAAQREVASRRAQRGGPAPPGQPSDAGVVSRACAPLFLQPACRDVMLRFDEAPPAERAATVQKVCAVEYCALLPPPKPAVCAHPADPPTDLTEWAELREAILKHDIGPELAARAFPPLRR